MTEHSQELAKLLGSEVSYADGSCALQFTAHEYLQNPRGFLPGGVLTTAMDISMCHLVLRIGDPGATGTLEAQCCRAASSGCGRPEGKVVHRSGSLRFLNLRVTTEDGELVALVRKAEA